MSFRSLVRRSFSLRRPRWLGLTRQPWAWIRGRRARRNRRERYILGRLLVLEGIGEMGRSCERVGGEWVGKSV